MSAIRLPWTFLDAGPASADANMADDRAALDVLTERAGGPARLRFFEWTEPVVTYGYLLDENLVRDWARPYGPVALVKRPTGGGAVYHTPSDLSLSLLWPRSAGVLPDKPQAAYAAIHEALRQGVAAYLGQAAPTLFSAAACADDKPQTPAERFSACFQKPVCDDVMIDEKKVIGGALRLTRKAILYQGAVQMGGRTDLGRLKRELRKALEAGLEIRSKDSVGRHPGKP